jgi:pimeloyl-ACP methyl ester carboxylesterase
MDQPDFAGIRRGYVDTRWGQLHFRETGSGPNPALVCLHATAYSGRTFLPLMKPLGATRRVLALDTPGYGESDGPPHEVNFEAYVTVIAEAIRELVPESPIDFLGYHTGALLATAIAGSHSGLVRRLVLIGIPYFSGEEKEQWRAKLVHKTTLTEQFDQFRVRWDYFVTNRSEGLSLSRGFDSFVDELKVYPREWWAHRALFDYEPQTQLVKIHSDTLVINTTSPLSDASTRAAAAIPGARVLSIPELKGAIFDLGAERLSREIEKFLGRRPEAVTS